jgi:translation initiation factor IF-1
MNEEPAAPSPVSCSMGACDMSALIVMFHLGAERWEARCDDGLAAASAILMSVAARLRVQPGDRIEVIQADDTLPETSRASHQSG